MSIEDFLWETKFDYDYGKTGPLWALTKWASQKSLFEVVDALISVSNLMMFSSCFDFSKEVEYEERIDYSDVAGVLPVEERRFLGAQQLLLISMFKMNKKLRGTRFTSLQLSLKILKCNSCIRVELYDYGNSYKAKSSQCDRWQCLRLKLQSLLVGFPKFLNGGPSWSSSDFFRGAT